MPDIKQLLDQIKCEMEESKLFSEDDLKALDLCMIDEIPVRPQDPIEIPEDDAPVPIDCINQVSALTEQMKNDLANSLAKQIAKSKLQEAYDNLSVAHEYFKVRSENFEKFTKTPATANTKKEKVDVSKALEQYAVNKANSVFSPIQFNELSQSFKVVLPKLRVYDYTDYDNKKQYLKVLDVLKNKKVFDDLSTVKFQSYEELPTSILKKSVYDSIRGYLYRSESGYPGFYWKLEAPMSRLFTLQERGLTTNPDLMDPALKTVGGTIEEDGQKFYIANSDAHEAFYQTFQTEFYKRVDAEKKGPLAKAISPSINTLRAGAINASIDAFKTSKDLKSTLKKFQDQFKEVDDRLKALATEIKLLESTINGKDLEDQIVKSKCFSQGSTDPCDTVKSALGSDPVGYKAMTEGLTGLNPDFTTMCYWKEFAKCATKLGLLPIPGDRMTNIRKLRYWPIGMLIPTPSKIIKIPMPHIWRPIVITTSPLGTIIVFIAQCGIVPSPFVFIISNTGSKSFVVSLKGPQKDMGYDYATTEKSNGTAGPIFKSNLKIKIPTLLGGIKSPIDAKLFEMNLEDSGSISNYIDDFKTKAIKAIDSIGEIRLNAVSRLNKDSADLQSKVEAIEEDLISAVKKMKLGSVKFPKDSGRLSKRKSAVQEVSDEFNDLLSRGEKMNDDSHFKVKHILEKFINDVGDLDVRINISGKSEAERVEQFKSALIKFNSESFKLAKGNKKIQVDPKILDKVESYADVQATVDNKHFDHKMMLASTVSTLMTGAKIELFSPFKSCCTAQVFKLPTVIDPAVALVLTAAERAIESIIHNLKNSDLAPIANLPNIGLATIKSYFLSNVLKRFPNVSLPKSIEIANAETLLKFITPVLGKLSIPQVPFLSVLGMPGQVTINLDNIVKPEIISVIRGTDFIKNKLAINIGSEFSAVSSEDLKACLKQAVDSISSNLKSKLEPITFAAAAFKSVKGASKTILDEAFPILKAKAEAKALLRSRTKTLDLVEMLDPASIGGVVKSSLATLAKTVNILGSHIPIVVLAALEQLEVARKIHPICNADDLPSWERLTLKNPLFVLFLDSFCATAADCTGVVLGRTWP